MLPVQQENSPGFMLPQPFLLLMEKVVKCGQGQKDSDCSQDSIPKHGAAKGVLVNAPIADLVSFSIL